MTAKSCLIIIKPTDYRPDICESIISVLYLMTEQLNLSRWYDVSTADFWYWFDMSDKIMCEAVLIVRDEILSLLDKVNPAYARITNQCGVYLLEIYHG